MRLIRLEVKGFGAFRDRTELNFEDSDFFALVGPTGSGKSTVIDAVCFALYGSVPRYDDKKLIRYVVSLGASDARVRLDFDLEGNRYTATRIVRRTASGSVTTKEARLERVAPDGASEVLAGQEREMSAAVVRLLGLEFDDFTRCVALPQGDFARFLRAKGEERRDLLLRLLNLRVYIDLGVRARQLAAQARSQIGLHGDQLQKLAFATADALAEARGRHAQVEQLRAEVEAAQPLLADMAAKEQQARARADQARDWAQRLEAIAVPGAVREFADEQCQAKEMLCAAEEALTEREAHREAAKADLAALPEIVPLQAVRAAYDALAACLADIVESEGRLQEAKAAEARMAAELDQADEAVKRSVADREAIHRLHLAHALSETLVVGEPCPVCDHVVGKLPGREPIAALADAERAVTEATESRDRAKREHGEATKLVASTEGQLKPLSKQRASLEAQIALHPDIYELDASIARVKAAEEAVARASSAEAEARNFVKKARAVLQALEQRALAAQRAFNAQRDTVVALEPPQPGHEDVLADWEALADWAVALVPQQIEVAIGGDEEADSHAKKRTETLAGLYDSLDTLGISFVANDDPVGLVSAVAGEATAASGTISQIASAMAEAAKLREGIAHLEEETEVAELLGTLLRADRFPEWLVTEALDVLVADASEILRRLTNGQYSLAVGEKEFAVIDHANADELRPARTLSGGETFQASLALALALSQQVRNLAADGAPSLDAIFLDEGFGSLDSETLDIVAATIENLGQSGRMVGIVTHVRELALRVPVRFEVRKGNKSSVVERALA